MNSSDSGSGCSPSLPHHHFQFVHPLKTCSRSCPSSSPTTLRLNCQPPRLKDTLAIVHRPPDQAHFLSQKHAQRPHRRGPPPPPRSHCKALWLSHRGSSRSEAFHSSSSRGERTHHSDSASPSSTSGRSLPASSRRLYPHSAPACRPGCSRFRAASPPRSNLRIPSRPHRGTASR